MSLSPHLKTHNLLKRGFCSRNLTASVEAEPGCEPEGRLRAAPPTASSSSPRLGEPRREAEVYVMVIQNDSRATTGWGLPRRQSTPVQSQVGDPEPRGQPDAVCVTPLGFSAALFVPCHYFFFSDPSFFPSSSSCRCCDFFLFLLCVCLSCGHGLLSSQSVDADILRASSGPLPAGLPLASPPSRCREIGRWGPGQAQARPSQADSGCEPLRAPRCP